MKPGSTSSGKSDNSSDDVGLSNEQINAMALSVHPGTGIVLWVCVSVKQTTAYVLHIHFGTHEWQAGMDLRHWTYLGPDFKESDEADSGKRKNRKKLGVVSYDGCEFECCFDYY